MEVAANDPTQPPAPRRQPAQVLVGWLDQLLRESAAPHGSSLLRVAGALGLRAYGRESERLHDALRSLGTDLVELDYGRVMHPDGSPRNPPDIAGFAPLYELVSAALLPTDSLTAELETWLEAHAGGVSRAQADLRLESQGLEAVLAYGDAWVADIWAELKERRASGVSPDGLAEVRRLAEAASRLGGRLRELHAATGAARVACQSAEEVIAARRGLVRMLRDDLRLARAAWVLAVEQLIEAAALRSKDGLPVQQVAQSDVALRTILDHCVEECDRLRQEQRALQRSLATTCELLRSAMQPQVPAPSPR